jgi:hypothetical protein
MSSVLLLVNDRLCPALLLASLLASPACASPSPPALAPVVTPPVDASPPPLAVDAQPAHPDLASTLCVDRTPCFVRRVRPAGHGAQGQALSVVSIDLGVTSEGDDDAGAPAEDDAGDITETAAEDTTNPSSGRYHRYEYWLTSDAPDTPPQLLSVTSNDGYGAAGVGFDVVTVGDNTLTRTQAGGSNWRWSYTNELTLSPLRVVSTTRTGLWSMGVNHEVTNWDWRRFAGTDSWYSPPCNAKGEPPDDPIAGAPYESELIPRLALPESFRRDGFRDVGLGACAVDLDGTGQHGFVTFGAKGDRAAASVRAVLSDRDELFAEVRDGRPSGASARWVADDHLEIWLSTEPANFSNFCLSKGEAPRQWGIRVSDGKVFAGYGSPSPGELTVDRAAKDAGLVRFRIGLPRGIHGITVAYSDGDGKKQQRVFATSVPKRGAPETLGATFDLKSDQAVCEVREGQLEPRVTPSAKAREPFADAPP